MRFGTFGKIAATAGILLSLLACGGGGTPASGGTGGTGISYGAVTDFGSIFVNGVEFSTSSASVMRDDVAVSESELRRGMVVEVRGLIAGSSGTASTVLVEEAVRGPLEFKTATPDTGATLIVLGQTVRVDGATLIDNNVCDGVEPCGTLGERFTALNAGDILEVHGQRTSDGSIAATFVEKKTALAVFVVRGTVASHSAAAQTFTVGALTVNYGGAIIGDMPAPSGSNWNGLFVEAKGTSCSGVLPQCGTLNATKVEPEGLGVAEAAQAEVEGFVRSLASTADFVVGTQHVLTNGATVFLGGDQVEIALGVKLEVEGALAGGVLTATKVKFKDSVKLESNATATATTMTLEGLPGITVTANAFTEFKDTIGGASETNLTPLNGRNVRIRGRASGAASVIASKIEDRGAAVVNADVILQGFATGATNPTFEILGVTVNTSQLDDPADFEDANDNAIGSTAFYSALAPSGTLVKAKGQLPAASNALDANTLRQVELED
jgi:hypothetical protein